MGICYLKQEKGQKFSLDSETRRTLANECISSTYKSRKG